MLTLLLYLALLPAAFAAYVLLLIARLRRMEGPRLRLSPPPHRGGIWLMSHRADEKRVYPFQHLFFRVTPMDQATWLDQEPSLVLRRDERGMAFLTIGAGPVEGKLTLAFNRIWDLEEPVSFEARVFDGGAVEENAAIAKLLAAARAYDNQERFSSWPPVNGPGHNCNSLMAALAAKSGLELPEFTRPFMLTTGSERPVPEGFFKNPHV